MLTIGFCDIEEEIEIGSLFEELGFHADTAPTDESGDSYIKNEWPIEALSLDGYYAIEGFRWTKPEQQVRLVCDSYEKDLLCSPEHIILKQNDQPAWVKVSELTPGDVIVTQQGNKRVLEVQGHDSVERLCDLQVSIAHSYFTNGILSHNSHFLTHLGCSAMRDGKNVLHFTFELSETAIGIRYDSNLCDMPSNEVQDRKNEVLKAYEQNKYGRLFIKEYPMNFATVNTLKSHYEKLLITKGIRPDLIVIDYADIMRSSRKYDDLRHELKLIYEELRAWATEIKTPIWTASQTNRSATESEVIGLESISEAYGKAMTSDVILTLSRRRIEKAGGLGRLYVAKNRAGRDGLLFSIKIDTAKSGFTILGAESPDKAVQEEENDIKRAIKEKWEKIRKDGDELKLKETVNKSEA